MLHAAARPRVPEPAARPAADFTDEPAADTVQFPRPQPRRLPATTLGDGDRNADDRDTLRAVERRLGQLVHTARAGVAVAAGFLLWQMFGDGFAWLATAATWAAGTLAVIAVAVGLGMYFSPGFRRAAASAGRSAAGGAVRWATRRR